MDRLKMMDSIRDRIRRRNKRRYERHKERMKDDYMYREMMNQKRRELYQRRMNLARLEEEMTNEQIKLLGGSIDEKPKRKLMWERFAEVLNDNNVEKFSTQEAIYVLSMLKSGPPNKYSDKVGIYRILDKLQTLGIVKDEGFSQWWFDKQFYSNYVGDAKRPKTYHTITTKTDHSMGEMTPTSSSNINEDYVTPTNWVVYDKDTGLLTKLGKDIMSLTDQDYMKLDEDIRIQADFEYLDLMRRGVTPQSI